MPQRKSGKAKKNTRISKTTAKNSVSGRVKVRMYRQGLGDCFLITFPRGNDKPFYMMIDCGVILGTQNAAATMQAVVKDIANTTDGHIDLLAVTHEHWDHLSGFLQARELFTKLNVGTVWMAWTEDPKDELANRLRQQHQALRLALSGAAARMGIAGNLAAAGEISSMLQFFGAAGSGTTTDALTVVKGLSNSVRFCRPGDPPIPLEGVDARIYVLGPPHDEKMIKKYNPSTRTPETYGLAAADYFLSGVSPALSDADTAMPFDGSFHIPLPAAQQTKFFQEHYWGEDADGTEKDQSWRRIDNAWLDSASSLALQLDSATNNTSLALAIELDNGDILLFAADAQVGNWLSWQNLTWDVDGHKVTGPDLLQQVRIYKAGHHGSHNATLKEKGLEMMTNLEIVLIPVDHAMAIKKRWGNMPLPELVDRMKQMAKDCVLRIDEPVPPQLKERVNAQDLYYEISI